jgi:cell division topological specificity factor
MIFKYLFAKKRSSKIAKERLEILLVTDRIGCNPYTTESIKRDIVNAISKYIEIDMDKCVIEIRQEKGPCLTANIPIKEVKVNV